MWKKLTMMILCSVLLSACLSTTACGGNKKEENSVGSPVLNESADKEQGIEFPDEWE